MKKEKVKEIKSKLEAKKKLIKDSKIVKK